jgi:hypothetical protein
MSDCVILCLWAAENVTESVLSSDPTKGFILGGASVGASMAAALSRQFQEQPLKFPLTGQWLAIPSLVDESCVPSRFRLHFVAREQSANSPILNKEGLEALQ